MNRSETNQGLQAYYIAKRQRTVALVQQAVDALVKQQRRVTIEAICTMTRALDPTEKGVHSSGVLGNPEAYAYYCQHSITHTTYVKRRKGKASVITKTVKPYHFRADRDPQHARAKYLHETRAELIERLLSVEQALAEMHQQLIRVQFALAEKQV